MAANSRLRAMAEERAAAVGVRVRVPRPGLCTDNGAMVAALGAEMVARGRTPSAAGPAGRPQPAGHHACSSEPTCHSTVGERMQQVKAVVARSQGRAGRADTINVPDPGPGEAVVKVQACGVCHTDLHYREGGINDDFPFLLGHEAAGVVEAVGPGVTGSSPATS